MQEQYRMALSGEAMRYDAKAIANYFLDLAEAARKPLSHMALQKLVYFAHGWNLGLIGQPLLNEEVQAWSFGPVIRSLYNEFREFGSEAITKKAREHKIIPGHPLRFRVRCPSIDDYQDENKAYVKTLLNRVWEVYGSYTAYQLSNLTHAPGTPWDRVNQKYGGQIPKYATIPDEWISEYFAKALEEPE